MKESLPEVGNLYAVHTKMEAITDLYNNLDPKMNHLPTGFGALLEGVLLEFGIVINDIEDDL